MRLSESLSQIKRSFWLLIGILAIACDEPKDPVVTTNIDAFLGEYRGIRSIECTDTEFNGTYVCETLVQDQVLLVTKGPSESTIDIMGYEVHVDKDGKFSCCPDLEYGGPIEVTIQNDTIKTMRGVRRSHGIYDTERFIGVKGAKPPLKAGTVGFRSASSEELENIDGPALIYLDIEDAKFGASIIIEILNPSTPDASGYYDYVIYGGDSKILSDNKIVVNVLANVTSATVGLHLANDLVPKPSRNIQFQISDESVGINVSVKKNHSFTIVDDD